jgi:tellurite resistance protein
MAPDKQSKTAKTRVTNRHDEPSGAETIHRSLIFAMVTMAAVDRQISDNELRRIGAIVSHLPVFRSFDLNELVHVAEECGNVLSVDGGLDTILDLIASGLPLRLHETAYALAVEIAAADLAVGQEEIRFLEMLADALRLDKLNTVAIERGARARHMQI